MRPALRLSTALERFPPWLGSTHVSARYRQRPAHKDLSASGALLFASKRLWANANSAISIPCTAKAWHNTHLGILSCTSLILERYRTAWRTGRITGLRVRLTGPTSGRLSLSQRNLR